MVLDCKSSLLDVLCFCTPMLNKVNRAMGIGLFKRAYFQILFRHELFCDIF